MDNYDEEDASAPDEWRPVSPAAEPARDEEIAARFDPGAEGLSEVTEDSEDAPEPVTPAGTRHTAGRNERDWQVHVDVDQAGMRSSDDSD